MIKLVTATTNQAKAPVNKGATPALLNCPKDTWVPIPTRAIAMNHCEDNFVNTRKKDGTILKLLIREAHMNHKINQGKIFFNSIFFLVDLDRI